MRPRCRRWSLRGECGDAGDSQAVSPVAGRAVSRRLMLGAAVAGLAMPCGVRAAGAPALIATLKQKVVDLAGSSLEA